MRFDPPRVPDVCDKCGGSLYRRDDDNDETIRARLGVFERQTQPVLQYYSSRGKLRQIDGQGAPADVLRRVVDAINQPA
jgi:adenylate kinase